MPHIALVTTIFLWLFGTQIAAAQTFADVPSDYWAYPEIEALSASGITGGCGGGNYCPEGAVTRAQMAVFLERAIRGTDFVPPLASGTLFGDVAIGDFAADYIEQLYADGITGGCGGSNYCPVATITRAQMAVFLLRSLHGSGYVPPAATGLFSDVDPTYWAASWIEQLAAEGVTNGCGGGNFCPESRVSRAQMAAFLVRAFGLGATPIPDSALSSLELSDASLDQLFQLSVLDYTATVSYLRSEIQVTATTADQNATLTIDGLPIETGTPSQVIPLTEGSNTISITVTGPTGSQTYTIAVTRSTAPALTQHAYIKPSDTFGSQYFGQAIAISGNTLVVGSPRRSREETGQLGGGVYVFVVDSDGNWTEQAILTPSNPDQGDWFGASVAIDGDLVVVGAPREDGPDVGIDGDQYVWPPRDWYGKIWDYDAGAVYAFERDESGNWQQVAYIKASNTGAEDWFGHAVAVSGSRVAVSAPNEDGLSTGINGDQGDSSLSTDTGAVYIFNRNAGVWYQEAYIKASNAGNRDQFGWSLSFSGDTLAVGAIGEDSDATGINGDGTLDFYWSVESGAAYVFVVHEPGNWSEQAYIKATTNEQNARFGSSLVVDGDRLVVSKPGSIYTFERSIDSWATWDFGIPLTSGGLYISLSNDNLVTARTAENAILYSYLPNGGQNDRVRTSWVVEKTLWANNGEPNDRFGHAVAISEGILAIGAYTEDSGATGINGDESDNSASASGAVYVFR